LRTVLTLASAAIVAPLGWYSKRGYAGPAAHWVHDSLGGVFYVIFWSLLLAAALPRWKPAAIARTVLIATCILEFLQLWLPPLLQWLRSFFIGRTILGSSFDWWDFPYYFAGAVLGWAWLRAIAAFVSPHAIVE
jgi:hypothetical protein